MRKIVIPVIVVVGLFVAYLSGPKVKTPVYSTAFTSLPVTGSNVANMVDSLESLVRLRPDNGAKIIWENDSLRNKTPYSVLYLHGFGACWYEGEPVHRNFAKAIGANLYLSRLWSHGIDTTEEMLDMHPEKLYESAKEALVIALALGDKVIVMGTSTGGTLALKLAADFPDKVNALILLSPNIAINNSAIFLVSGPWGLQIARTIGGGGLYRDLPSNSETEKKYWYKHQRWESVVYLQQLVKTTMKKEVFGKIDQPVFLGYYYKNEEEQDPVVRVDAMLDMFDRLGTPDSLKTKVAFPEAGDHVIGCTLLSKSWKEVEGEAIRFARGKVIRKAF